MQYQDLSKPDKKIIRELIDKGVMREFEQGILKLDRIIDKWKDKKLDNREAYHALYKQINIVNDHIAFRYDGLTGSRYVNTVVMQLVNDVLTENDLEGLTPEVRENLIATSAFLKE